MRTLTRLALAAIFVFGLASMADAQEDFFSFDTLVWTKSADPTTTSYDVSMVLSGGTPGVAEVGALDDFVPSDLDNPSALASQFALAGSSGTVYEIFVRANNSSGAGPWSDAYLVTLRLTPPKVTDVGKAVVFVAPLAAAMFLATRRRRLTPQ